MQPILPSNISILLKSQIIDTIIKAVKKSYVFPEKALQITTALIKHQEREDYNKIKSSKEFADTISNQLVLIGNDKHLRILYSYDTVPQKTDKNPPIPDFIKTFAIENNFDFKASRIDKLIQKPFRFAEMLEMIKIALER